MKHFKNFLALLVVAALAYNYLNERGITLPGLSTASISAASSGAESDLQNAYDQQLSDVQVRGEGIVKKLLRDDLNGSRHQRFILSAGAGKSILIAHNIDLAPRIDALQKGDRVEFYGEYEWNQKGGIVHWTHHDPGGRHTDGWLKHEGRVYQ